MLSSWLSNEMVQFINDDLNWKEAIRKASEPLLRNGYIEQEYIEVMIENVNKLGPYIVLMPNVAMPHARPENGVRKTGVSLMVTERSVLFDDDKPVKIFFVIAAKDGSSHLSLLQELSGFLSNEKNITALLSVKNNEDILKLI